MNESLNMNQLIYTLTNVVKNYGGRQILSIEKLTIQKSEILAIVGPSGAGKSTLLRLLNFLESPDTGSIEFQGEIFHAIEKIPLLLRRRITTVFQQPMLLNRSVWENVAYGLRLRGFRNSGQEVWDILEEIGLTGLYRQPARTLSGGEAQRVALARAMILQPDVLLLDEPTANLDPQNVGLIEDFIRKSNRLSGTTIVLVTHNIFQARRLANRVAFLMEGKVVESANTETFFQSPTDPRTRSFIHGDMVY